MGLGQKRRRLEIPSTLLAETWALGFAYLVNHGVAQRTIDDMFAYSKRFFELPGDVKDTVRHPPEGENHRYSFECEARAEYQGLLWNWRGASFSDGI